MALNCPVSSFATAKIAAANVIYAWPAPLCHPDTIGPMLPPTLYRCPRSSVSDLSEKLRKERMLVPYKRIRRASEKKLLA